MHKLLFATLALLNCAFCEDFEWTIRKGFPRPVVPADNPMSAGKVELGRHLFYDKRMSVNGGMSCASCHRQELAFTDGKPRAEGVTGMLHPRSAMSLVNVAYIPQLTWAHPKLDRLEEQALVPLLGVDPVELGMKGQQARFMSQVQGDPVYQRLLPQAFPDEKDPYSITNAMKAIAAFERTINSTRSTYDHYRYDGVQSAISESAKRGEILFFSSERAGCFQCHGGWNFSGPIVYEGLVRKGEDAGHAAFHNTGLYNLPGLFSYPAPNSGLHQHTGRPRDVGRFRAPTLRNVEVTAPYMHDGSIATLEEVIGHYSNGGRAKDNPNKSPIIRPFPLSVSEKRDLVEFLKTLTDHELLQDKRWSDPWPEFR